MFNILSVIDFDTKMYIFVRVFLPIDSLIAQLYILRFHRVVFVLCIFPFSLSLCKLRKGFCTVLMCFLSLWAAECSSTEQSLIYTVCVYVEVQINH